MQEFIDNNFRLNENQYEKAGKYMAQAEVTIIVMVAAIGVLYLATHLLAPKLELDIEEIS